MGEKIILKSEGANVKNPFHLKSNLFYFMRQEI